MAIFKKDFIYVFVNIYAHMCRCLWRPEEEIRSLGAGIAGVCDFPWCGYWVLTLVFMVEQQVLLSCLSRPGQ